MPVSDRDFIYLEARRASIQSGCTEMRRTCFTFVWNSKASVALDCRLNVFNILWNTSVFRNWPTFLQLWSCVAQHTLTHIHKHTKANVALLRGRHFEQWWKSVMKAIVHTKMYSFYNVLIPTPPPPISVHLLLHLNIYPVLLYGFRRLTLLF